MKMKGALMKNKQTSKTASKGGRIITLTEADLVPGSKLPPHGSSDFFFVPFALIMPDLIPDGPHEQTPATHRGHGQNQTE
ncbi:MAG: hypothetical protein Q8K00_13160 [Syntrophales bacterium]|nr:hypothetical protein [Syntrophales bacterium]